MKIPARVQRFLPVVGRFTPSQITHLGEILHPPAFFNWGPVIILIDLPERFQKAEPEASLADLNQALNEFFSEVREQLNKAPEA